MWSYAAGSASRRSRTPATSAFVFRGTRVLTSSSGSAGVAPSGATSPSWNASEPPNALTALSTPDGRPWSSRSDSKAHALTHARSRASSGALGARSPRAQCARQPCIAATSATE